MNKKRTIFTFNDVPVNARPSFWPMWLLGWVGFFFLARWRDREWPNAQNALVGLLSLLLAMTADIGHALAHTISAKLAGAPMDEILLAADMPRTLYDDHQVSPRAHQIRAIGGPIFSFTNLLISLIWRKTTAPGSLARELATIACWANGLIGFGSLAPLSVVDGGTLLKWTLVERGRSEVHADTAVRTVNLAFGFLLGLFGLLVAARRWMARHS